MNIQSLIHSAREQVRRAAWQREIRRQTGKAIRETLFAARNCDRELSQAWLEILLTWNQLQKRSTEATEIHNTSNKLTYVVDSWFLSDLIKHLTPTPDEHISYITGVTIGELRVLSRICSLSLQKQSVVYALAAAQSCTSVLAEIHERGYKCHVMAHSHPGKGLAATRESGIDTKYLRRVQHAGADIIGAIVVRDGFVRFFTVEKPFEIVIQGAGVTEVDDHVFRIAS
jgi:hypothetical protein